MNKYIITLSLNGEYNNVCFKGESKQDVLNKFHSAKIPYPYDSIVGVMEKNEWKMKKFGMLGNPIQNPYGRVSKSIRSSKPKRTQIRKK